jgi:hypothetical protein
MHLDIAGTQTLQAHSRNTPPATNRTSITGSASDNS